jgi:hypothetical protein
VTLVVKRGDEYRLRISTAGKGGAEHLRLRVTQPRVGYDLGLLSAVPGIKGRVIGEFRTEPELWAAIASLASTWPATPPLPPAGQYELATLLAILGIPGKVLDSHLYSTEAELWAGLADHAAGRQADLALAMLALEENAARGSRERR